MIARNIAYITLILTSLAMTVAWIVELGFIDFVLLSMAVGLVMGLYAANIDNRVIFDFKIRTIFQATLLLGIGSMMGPIGPIVVLTALSTLHSIISYVALKRLGFPMLGV